MRCCARTSPTAKTSPRTRRWRASPPKPVSTPLALEQILASGDYADEVRAQERYYTERGIRAVPSVIINDRHVISGGQPVEVFEQALRKIAAQA